MILLSKDALSWSKMGNKTVYHNFHKNIKQLFLT